MGRKSLFLIGILTATVLRLEAQTSSFDFIENKGQWNGSVKFKGELSSGSFFLQQKGFTVLLHNPNDLKRLMGHHDHGDKPVANIKKSKKGATRPDVIVDGSGRLNAGDDDILRSHAYQVIFVGANEKALITPEKPLPTYNNYLIGNDSSKWASHVNIYQGVVYKDIYPNIDIRYYSENSKLKYDLIIHPGGDPHNIVLKYAGTDKLSIKNKELVIKTSVGEVKELYPYSFQPDNVKGRKEIACKYVLEGDNTVRFELADYSKTEPLIIDPSLVFVSFTGSPADNYGFTATPGPDGSFFSGGIVFGSDFPTTPGAFQSSFNGSGKGVDIGIMKFSPNGSQRVYATYLGGNGNDYPHSLISDAQGNLVIMGRSYSTNYPGTVEGSVPNGDANIIVTKLNAAGSNYIGSLIIGGSGNDGVNVKDILQTSGTHAAESLSRNYGDDSRSEVVLDRSENIYVAAQTQSDNFPIRGGGFQSALGGAQDGVVIKINSNCTAITWSTYLGGQKDDGAFVLDINPITNNVYVAGGTLSQDFPGDKSGTLGPSYHGTAADTSSPDAFVAYLSNDGRTLIKSTFIGTAKLDLIYGIKFDKIGFPYIMGITRGGALWPIKNALYRKDNSSQFISKLQPDLSDNVYSTLFGTGSQKPNMSPVAFLVDRCENVYVSGWGGWIGQSNDPYDMAGVAGMETTADAIQRSTDNRDFYFAVIKKDATQLLYGTFFGQNGGIYGEHVDGGTSRYDQQGVIYQAICANCDGGGSRFPTTPGVVGPVNGALPGGCNLAAVKISFNFAGVASGPRSFFNNVPDSVGCAPFTVTLRDTVRNAKSYEWNFGDGSDTITNAFDLVHTFVNVGSYRIRLIAVDSTTCNMRDTAYINIVVRDDKANLDFDIQKLLPCEMLSYRFDNLSTAPPAKPYTGTSFIWDFGDGSRLPPTGTGAQNHSYLAPGTYNVTLILNDTNYCNSPDSLTKQLRVAPLVKAQFETPLSGCVPYDAVFVNTSLAGQTFTWDFGDGSPTVNDVNPTHNYPLAGTFIVTLTAIDSGTCNIKDVTTKSITVSNRPTAAFTYTPVVPEVNKPTIFYNQSIGGVRYKWLFGDGDSTLKTTNDTTLHQYNASGTYNACLITYNQFGCTDTACHEVKADILPLLDVPNAFTPGKFGRNATVQVEGFGITRMVFRIYNRWGQKVFETNNRKLGWDGFYNGLLQPMDVYAYTLDVEFSDGTKAKKTGDITLIR